MLDDIREWISDNLRYILLGLAGIVVIVIIVLVVRLVSGSSKKDDQTQNTPVPVKTEDQGQNTVDEGGEDVAEEATEAGETGSVSSLVKDDAAVLTLVRNYYTARAAKDTATLSEIVTPWDSASQDNLLQNDLIESYNEITTWSRDGLDEGTFVAFTCFKAKIADFETLVPSLRMLYLITEDGKLKVFANYESDSRIAGFVADVARDADVQQLLQQVNDEYALALESDAELASYLSDLTADAQEEEPAEQQEAAKPGDGEKRTALYGLNIREQTSTESNILGSIPANSEVEVLQDVDDGWSQISFDPGTGAITGYVRTEYLS